MPRPTLISKPGPELTRDDVIAALRSIARNGTLSATDVQRASSKLYVAAGRLWGSFPRARHAAGLAAPLRSRPWTRERILTEIRALHRSGQRMTSTAVREAGRFDLVAAAVAYLGSWPRARELAGVSAPPREEPRPRGLWDRRSMIAEIQRRRRAGVPLAWSKVPRSLQKGAKEVFGSWQAAIEAAGFDYRQVSLKVIRDDDELLDWLRSLARKSPQMRWSAVRNAKHGQACVRRWGSLEEAVRVAGLAGWPVRGAFARMTKDQVLAALRAMARTGTPLNIHHVQNQLGHRRLVRGAVGHFGSWDAAIAAAGLRPQRRQRTAWTRDEAIAYLRRRHRQGHSLAVSHVKKDQRSFEDVARRLFGTYAAAVAAAGLTYTPLQVQRSRPSILEELRALARRRRALRRRDVPMALLVAIEKRWGSFAAACVEAGVPYHDPRTSGRERG